MERELHLHPMDAGPDRTEYGVVELPPEVDGASSSQTSTPAALDFDLMAQGGKATVCSVAPKDASRSDRYQTEAELEAAFIRQLQRQAYEYASFASEAELIANLRHQLELLNETAFSDAEWTRFFAHCIAGENEGIAE